MNLSASILVSKRASRLGAQALALIASAGLLSFGSAVLAQGDSRMPPRQSGLWETTTSAADRAGAGINFQQCVDAKTEQDASNQFSRDPKSRCTTSNVRNAGGIYEADYACETAAGKVSGHIKRTGDVASRYTLTNTMRRDPPPPSGPAEQTVVINAVYKGVCPPDMKPGESRMAGVPMPKPGEKMTPEQIQKMMEQFKPNSSGK